MRAVDAIHAFVTAYPVRAGVREHLTVSERDGWSCIHFQNAELGRVKLDDTDVKKKKVFVMLFVSQGPEIFKRVQAGDQSPQALAELAASYVLLCQTAFHRSQQLERQSLAEIRDRFEELGLDKTHRVGRWAGKEIKTQMVGPIVRAEYPKQEYIDALESAGLDPKAIEHYHVKYIQKAC